MLIGSVFALAEPEPHATGDWPFDEQDSLLTYNARSALWLLLQDLQPTRLWLPSFVCPDLLQAVPAGCRVHYYPLNQHLAPEHLRWTRTLGSNDVVLVCAFFGFPPPAELTGALQDSPATVVLDAAQALFLRPEHPDWFYLYSPRKWAGLPDGGVLCGGRKRSRHELEPVPATHWLTLFQALLLRRDQGPQPPLDAPRPWFERFREAEASQPTGAWAMSSLSRALLFSGLDSQQMRARRRANYQQLAAAFSDCALFPDLPASVVPLGFPIQLAARDRLQTQLAARGIFCAIHWRLKDIPAEFSASHTLARRILTLPCDQRYGTAEMAHLVAQVQALRDNA
jgi:hypothetical protein